MFVFFLFCVAALASGSMEAQKRDHHLSLLEYQKQEWQVEDGLPENNVRMISQQPDGTLLLATFSGVSAFDGLTFERLNAPYGQSTGGDPVNAVIAGTSTDLWIGTDGRGVIHQTSDGSINISEAAGRLNERVRDMYLAKDGTLWIATQNGVERYSDHRLESIANVGIIGGDLTKVFAPDQRDGMFFVTSMGLFHWHAGRTRRLPVQPSLGDPVAAYRDRNGHIWVGTSRALLEVTRKPRTEHFNLNIRAELPSQVTAFASGRGGELWIGTKRDGMWRWDEDQISHWGQSDGLPDDCIRTLFVDDEDNLWIGMLTGGLSRWRKAPFAPLRQQHGFAPSYAAVAFGDSHGDLWLGTWGQGVFRRRGDSTSPVTLPGTPPTNPIRAITEDLSGRIWIGTWFNGIYCYDGHTYRRYTIGIESPANAISVLYFDTKGALWVGTYTGLLYFPDGIPLRGRAVEVLPGKLITDLLEEHGQGMLAGTSSGLYRIREGKPDLIRGMPHPYVLSLSRDSHNTIWAAPRTGGLAYINGNTANPVPADSGLPQLPVYNMVEDNYGKLFLGTSRGIVRVAASELDDVAHGGTSHISATQFGKSDGMPSSDCSGPSKPSATHLRDGTLFFATSKGFVHTTAFTETAPLPVPVARMTGWSFGNDAKPGTLQNGSHVQIAAGETDVMFRFGAKRLANPSQVEFRYRLAGYDSGWVTTHSRYARYRRIDPGSYTFEVQARTSGEPWSGPVVSLPVYQTPHLYNTYSFYLLAATLVFAIMAQLYSRRIRRLKGNMGIVLEERNRIARECHDSLMAGFAAISWQLEALSTSLSDRAQETSAAVQTCDLARNMVAHCQAEARRIIWDLRDTDEVTGVLSQALSRAISAHNKPEHVETRMGVEGTEILLPPASVHHLVCMGLEAVSNALRHSEARLILVHLRYSESALVMTVRDDGHGFSVDRTQSHRGHFGLLVMEERARRIGGKFAIQSFVGRGTEVTVELPYVAQDTAKGLMDHQVIRWIGI